MCTQERRTTDAVVWRLSGPLTADVGEWFECALNRARAEGRRRIVIDLGGVAMTDAGGLGVLATACRWSATFTIALGLARVSRQLHHMLAITKLTDVLPIFESVEEALRDSPSVVQTAVASVSGTALEVRPGSAGFARHVG